VKHLGRVGALVEGWPERQRVDGLEWLTDRRGFSFTAEEWKARQDEQERLR
jgi:hypothetical protein